MSLPEARAFGVAVTIDEKAIFAAHPYAQFLALAPRIYHLANNSWTAGPDIGRGRSSGVAGNEIPHLLS